MGGLIKKMPQTAILFIIAAMAICGLPPFNGFISEFLIYLGLFEGVHSGSLSITTVFILLIAGLALIGGLALLCFTKAFGIIFLGQARSHFDYEINESEPSKLFPGYLIVCIILIIGLFPQWFIRLLINPVSVFTTGMTDGFPALKIISNLQSISLVAWVFLLAIASIWTIKRFVLRNKRMVITPTWSCGYSEANSKMQYTASSYVRSYRKLIGPFLIMNKKEGEIKGVFSSPIHSQTHPYDKVEAIFIDFPLKIMNKMMARVRFIQNGNMRHYILYGVVFITIIVFISLLSGVAAYLFNLIKQM
jgi:NADH:ubiquinone oxidoreductase subunit 5 (subunit L)/multisubunit Na+/H+ antiporter MnhA subunit